MSKKIDELITQSGVAIQNGINQPAIAALLLEFGYTPERMAAGEHLHNEANKLNIIQKKEDGEQQAATKELNEAIDATYKVYIPHLKVARIAFRNDTNRWVKLDLGGDRKKSQSGLLGQTKLFYTNLLEDADALARMAEFGQTNEKLETGSSLVLGVEKSIATRKKEMGEAQTATKDRDKAVDELQEWYSDYIGIARLALAEQPQYLEMLGIVEPS
nr:hypothetical protein [uncultured Carboxylicivirga sp.]